MKAGIPYALTFGAGFVAAHMWRAKQVTPQKPHTPGVAGQDTKMTTMGLDMGAHVMQKFAPLQAIHMHLYGVHFYSGNLQKQIQAHHFCSHLNEDFHQCVIYDNDTPNSKLIGIEYIISEKLYKSLPEDEKKLWHSHINEVKSGLLACPGIPDQAEHKVMETLVNRYGKTFHTWQVDRGDQIPMGVPQLMMAFTNDGQVHEHFVKERDQKYKISIQDKKQNRKDIKVPEKDPSADYWEKSGRAIQVQPTEINMQNKQSS